MGYGDLRDWLDQVDRFGEVLRLDGASWNLEMGGLCEIVVHEANNNPPLLLFDEIPDYPKGTRSLFGLLCSVKRLALTAGLPLQYPSLMDFVRAFHSKLRTLEAIPAVAVEDGPVAQNVMEGEEVDLYRFPVPFHHELDGGRYFGTAHAVITRHPEDGWHNLGTYRCMVHDKKTLGLHISGGKHGRIHRDMYFERGEPMKVAVAAGLDPAIYLSASLEVPWGLSEYDYAGGLKGEPVQIMRGPYTGLPIPATAEIVVEGDCYPGELKNEGPFGEWAGYYANRGLESVPEPVIHVKRIMHRTDPILTCAQPARPPHEYSFPRTIIRSGLVWNELEKAGVPDIKGVWCHEAGGSRLFTVVSITQRYPGHARQAGILASQVHSGAYVGRYVVVVDEDIDPSNTYDVLWAIATRSEPVRSVEILRRGWSSSADPALPPDEKLFNSRCIIDACKPYEWKDRFYPVAETSKELRASLLQKWGEKLFKDQKYVLLPKEFK
ncbi:MAG: UbiD family decarboxylase [Deltaproteobacteria bacterium]|nr:UbiD family decarboxylase [Deltaproteobacteria bacterium]